MHDDKGINGLCYTIVAQEARGKGKLMWVVYL